MPAELMLELALRERAQLLDTLFAACPLPILVDDAGGRVILANRAFCDAFGYGEHECVGRTVAELVVPSEQEASFEEARRTVMGGSTLQGPARRRRKDGSLLFIELHAVPIFANGEYRGSFATYQDIGSRVKTESATQQSEELLRILNEEVPMGIFLMDTTGKAVYQNASVSRITGLSEEDIQRGRITAPAGPDDRELVSRNVQHSFAGRLLQTQFRFVKPNGDTICVSNRGKPIRGADGSVRSWLGVIEDITCQYETLERLRQAKTAAEDANRTKSELLARVSHEIRTPIDCVIGMTELMLDTDLTMEQRDCLGMVKASADSLVHIFNSMLDLSGKEVSRLDVEGVAFSPREHLASLLKALALQARRKHLELIGHVLADVPTVVVGDPERLQQVLINLVGNALKFTERGSVRVLVYVESEAPGGVSLHYAVSDTGIGVDRAKQQQIFQPVQTEGSATQRFGETGLGLAISSSLVDLMGGRIWVESEPHEGSTFHFTACLGVAPPASSSAADTHAGGPGSLVSGL
jgi:two-component system, sensor histidine kinase and response regulator